MFRRKLVFQKKEDLDLDLEAFLRLRDLVYRRTGIFFEEKKLYFVKKRVRAHMEALGFKDFDTYYRFLRFRDDGKAFQELINLLTTNETYFFREFDQLAVFAEECLPLLCNQKLARGERRLRLWSAGCSTGEEPYTLAIILLEMIDDLERWDAKIEATDIDTNALAQARRGIYGPRSVRNVPKEYLKRYFRQLGSQFEINEKVRALVRFSQLNLFDEDKMSQMKGFDFIFCRNVLIYFDERSRKKVVSHFYRALNPGGFIFLGHSESLSRITTAFRAQRLGGMIVYQKPEESQEEICSESVKNVF
ncbi:CheR family methyltransferase [Thermosulfuriphilus sp.]